MTGGPVQHGRGPSIARGVALLVLLSSIAALESDDPPLLEVEVTAFLTQRLLAPEQTRREAIDLIRNRLPSFNRPSSSEAWEREAERLRAALLDQMIGRGAGKTWGDAPLRAEFLGAREGGPGYSVEALRFEVVPGSWIPAWIYRPQPLQSPAPVMIAFIGHEPEGFRTKQVQLRSINLAKRGIVVLSPEWFGQGLLSSEGFQHEHASYLELVGTPGLAVFHQTARRALEVALSLDGIDPRRVGASGLSGGGWQSLLLGALDPRVSLVNSVAGFSTFATRLDHFDDLGDFEQLPSDFATLADYTHLVAMLAPRPTLLGYNAKDDCCFRADYTLAPILEAAGPVFELFRPSARLETHIDGKTPSHNFDRDHREALYSFLDRHWYEGQAPWSAEESDLEVELRGEAEMQIPLPDDNLDFPGLALSLLRGVERDEAPERSLVEARAWQDRRQLALRTITKLGEDLPYRATLVGEVSERGVTARQWRLELGPEPKSPVWTVPVTELDGGGSLDTVVLFGDLGRSELAATVGFELARGRRVIAVDPFLTGEARVDRKPYRLSLLISAVGARALGIRIEQLRAVTRWAREQRHAERVELRSEGRRSSLTAMLAAALSPDLIDALTLVRPLPSLRALIEDQVSFVDMPEVPCFGLLAEAEVSDLLRLIAPRPLTIEASPADLPPDFPAALNRWNALFAREHELEGLPAARANETSVASRVTAPHGSKILGHE